MREGGAGVADTLQMAYQRPHRVEKEARETLLLGRNPVFIEARQQRPLIEIDGACEKLRPLQGAVRFCRRLQRLLELCDIGGDGRWIEADTKAIGADHRSL